MEKNPFWASSATEEQQEGAVKGVWAQKVKDLAHALSRASFSISCPLSVKRGTVTLREGEPKEGPCRVNAAAVPAAIAHGLQIYIGATFCRNLVKVLGARLLYS